MRSHDKNPLAIELKPNEPMDHAPSTIGGWHAQLTHDSNVSAGSSARALTWRPLTCR
jgi:hypothetical protein